MLERMVAIGDPTFRAAFEAQFLKLIQKLCSSPNIAPVRASAWVGVNEKYGPGCGCGRGCGCVKGGLNLGVGVGA